MSYVLPHKLISRFATLDDTQKIMGEGAQMIEMCTKPPKHHQTALAIAHAQVDDIEPIRFFVTNTGEIIINPIITRHTNHTYTKKEGCTTFGNIPWSDVERWQKIEVTYWVIDPDGNGWLEKSEAASGKRAQMFQHEIDHMEGKYVYGINWDALEQVRAKRNVS